LFFLKNKILNLCLSVSLLVIAGCKKTDDPGTASQNPQVNKTTLSAGQVANHSASFENGWDLTVAASADPIVGTITITCHLTPQPVSGHVYYEINVNNAIYTLQNNSITIGAQPSTTYSITATAYYYTSIGTTNIATASTSVKTGISSGIPPTNPGCPKSAPLFLFPSDTSTMANRAGWTFIQYDWGPPPGTTHNTSGTAQLRYRATGSNTWSYGQMFPFSMGSTDPNHFFIINLIPGQSYQVQLGVDCGTGVAPVEADFATNQIYSITAGPM
ncbi:MAG: hypothetical protein JWR09_5856, partial [Mucilaginibacter sp.]|nr:hypothetical protein [Mucilaginibacter sp.]